MRKKITKKQIRHAFDQEYAELINNKICLECDRQAMHEFCRKLSVDTLRKYFKIVEIDGGRVTVEFNKHIIRCFLKMSQIYIDWSNCPVDRKKRDMYFRKEKKNGSRERIRLA